MLHNYKIYNFGTILKYFKFRGCRAAKIYAAADGHRDVTLLFNNAGIAGFVRR
jgi:hypothetical protein